VPIAYQKFAEKEQEKELAEIDMNAAKLYLGKAIFIVERRVGKDKVT
jgi:hypothetical protein